MGKKKLPHTSLIWIHQENSTTIVEAVMAIILDILTTSNSPEIRVTGNVMPLKGNMPTAQIDTAGWNCTSSKKKQIYKWQIFNTHHAPRHSAMESFSHQLRSQ